MHGYTFDVKMFAVIQIQAENFEIAKKILDVAISGADITVDQLNTGSEARVVEASIYVDDEQYPFLTEFDGNSTDDEEISIE